MLLPFLLCARYTIDTMGGGGGESPAHCAGKSSRERRRCACARRRLTLDVRVPIDRRSRQSRTALRAMFSNDHDPYHFRRGELSGRRRLMNDLLHMLRLSFNRETPIYARYRRRKPTRLARCFWIFINLFTYS